MSVLTESELKKFSSIINGYVLTQALSTACDLDLFTFLSKKPGATIEDICEYTSCSKKGIRVLLLGCCYAGLLQRDQTTKGYSNSELSEKILVNDSPSCMIPFVKFNDEIQHRCSLNLTKSIKEGRNAGLDEFPSSENTLYERFSEYPNLESLFQEAMNVYFKLSPMLIDLEEFQEATHLLDVGGGKGVNAIRLCRKYPSLKVSVFEIPTVCRIAQDEIDDNGLASRINCVEGNMFSDSFGTGYDTILLSRIVEIFDHEKIELLYRKTYEALPKGGKLIIWTLMANEFETGGLQAAKTSMYLFSTASGEGMTYPEKDHEQLLKKAHFSTIRVYPRNVIDHGAIVAIK